MNVKTLLVASGIMFSMTTLAQSSFSFTTPPQVESVLKLSRDNKNELKTVLNYYAQKHDSLKWKAACFLIGNMDIHFSEQFYWETHEGKVLKFNELDYPDFRSAVAEFNRMSTQKHLHLKSRIVPDIQIITADLLIKNIDLSFKLWNTPQAKHLNFSEFCEYLLPYRSTCEPLESWKPIYNREFKRATVSGKETAKEIAEQTGSEVMSWYFVTYGIENKQAEGMISPSCLLFRKQGSCENLSNLAIFAMRSQGIATTFDFTPHWATSTGRHYWNCIIDENHVYQPFVGCGIGQFKPKREPGKVIRITYSRQLGTPATQLSQQQIPEGFMRTPNFIDVTKQYWKCTDFTINAPTNDKFIYASVLNGLKWRPVFYASKKNNQYTFHKMTCGVIYLPFTYSNGQMLPVSSPILVDKDGNVETKNININRNISLFIPEKDLYLRYRIGKKYTLHYWNREWVKVETQTASSNKGLTFDKVPDNTIYLLIPEYSRGKERPFTIDKKRGICYW